MTWDSLLERGGRPPVPATGSAAVAGSSGGQTACCLKPMFCRLIGPASRATPGSSASLSSGTVCNVLSSLGIIFMHNDMTPLTLISHARVSDIPGTPGGGSAVKLHIMSMINSGDELSTLYAFIDWYSQYCLYLLHQSCYWWIWLLGFSFNEKVLLIKLNWFHVNCDSHPSLKRTFTPIDFTLYYTLIFKEIIL